MGNASSKAVAVIELKGDKKPSYNVRALKDLLKNGPAKEDTKVFVICISGVCRSGKSFLLNLLKTYLDHYCEHQTDDGWIGNGDVRIRGGNWAQGQLAVTHGILMYMYPQLVDNKAIILMDCQGTKDCINSTPALDNQIMFLALQLSDVHILNVNGMLSTDDMDRLGLCLYHADDDSTEKLFRRQMFLIRNWEHREEPQQLDDLIDATVSRSVKDTANGIRNAFEAVHVVSLPHPGPGVAGKSESSKVLLHDVDGKFLEKACVLFHRLIQEFSVEARFNGEEFLQLFERTSSRAVEKISTPLEAYEESLIQGLYRRLMETANVKIEQLKTEVTQLTVKMVQERVAEVFQEARDHFVNHKRVKSCKNQHIIDDHLDLMEKNQKDINAVVVNHCKIFALTSENEEKNEKLAKAQVELDRNKEDLERKTAEIKQVQKDKEQTDEKLQREIEYGATRLQEQEEANALQMSQLEEKHQQQMKITKEAFGFAENSLKDREKIERDLQAKHDKDMDKLVNSNADAMKQKREDYEKLTNKLLEQQEKHKTKLDDLQNEKSKLEKREVQLESDNKIHEATIDRLNKRIADLQPKKKWYEFWK